MGPDEGQDSVTLITCKWLANRLYLGNEVVAIDVLNRKGTKPRDLLMCIKS